MRTNVGAVAAALRLRGKRIDRVFKVQHGPALPHVIATLKAIVGSALRFSRRFG